MRRGKKNGKAGLRIMGNDRQEKRPAQKNIEENIDNSRVWASIILDEMKSWSKVERHKVGNAVGAM